MIGSWFATDYDEQPVVLDGLPLEVTSGMGPGMAIVDQVVRGRKIVGRVTADYGAIGLKVRGAGVPVRVTVLIHLDELGTRWWSDRVRPSRLARELPRVVLVRAQGALRGGAVLARRQGLRSAGGAKVTVEFDLAAEDLDENGLLMIELAEPPRPEWTAGRISARAALGVRIDKITVRPRPATPLETAGATGCDLAVLAADGPGTFRLQVTPVTPAPPLPVSPSHKWTRKKPARAGFKVLRAARRAGNRVVAEVAKNRPVEGFGVRAADLRTGEPVELEILERRPGSVTLRRSGESRGALLVGLAEANQGLSCRVVPGGGK